MDAVPLPSVSRMFSETWQLYKSRFGVLLGITGLGGVASLLCVMLSAGGFAGGFAMGGTALLFGGLLALAGVCGLIAAGAWAQAALIEGALAPEGVTIRSALRSSLAKTLPLAWAFSLYLAAAFGGLFFLIIPGLAAGVWLIFAPFICVEEGVGGLDSLWRSYEYVRGRWWAVAGRLALVNVFVAAASSIPVLGFFISLVSAPFSLANAAVLYRHLRAARGDEPFTEPSSGAKALLILPMAGLVLPFILLFALVPRVARMGPVFSRFVQEAGSDPQKAEALTALLKGEKDPRSVAMALQLMQTMGGAEAADPASSSNTEDAALLQSFLEGPSEAREAARKALEAKGVAVLSLPAVQTKVDALIAELESSDPALQARAAEALGGIGEPRALEALQRAAQGKSPAAAPEVFAAIGKIASRPAPSDKASAP